MIAPGSHDGVYRYVAHYAVPDYLAQGWTVEAMLGPYSVLMKAPI
jgi:hypothetical protein